jgi:hypothetical protein
MKIEHILDSNVKYDPNKQPWTEIDFCRLVGNKYPEQFTKLYDYDIVDNCLHEQKYPINPNKIKDEMIRKHIIELRKSKHCVRRIFSLIDGTLDEIIKNLTQKEYQSTILQLINIVCLIHSNGYVHGDLHYKNIGFVNTKKEYINIFGRKVPTYGRIFKAIDYGTCTKKITKNDQDEELFKIVRDFLYEVTFWKAVDNKEIKYNFQEDKKRFLQTKENKILMKYSNSEKIRFSLYWLLYPKEHQKSLGIKKVYEPIFYVPKEDVLRLIKSNDCKMYFDYFKF